MEISNGDHTAQGCREECGRHLEARFPSWRSSTPISSRPLWSELPLWDETARIQTDLLQQQLGRPAALAALTKGMLGGVFAHYPGPGKCKPALDLRRAVGVITAPDFPHCSFEIHYQSDFGL